MGIPNRHADKLVCPFCGDPHVASSDWTIVNDTETGATLWRIYRTSEERWHGCRWNVKTIFKMTPDGVTITDCSVIGETCRSAEWQNIVREEKDRAEEDERQRQLAGPLVYFI